MLNEVQLMRQPPLFMTRSVQRIFRLTVDTGRSGVEGGVSASTLFFGLFT